MHDIWNPWHGCRKISEGCQHCYMYFLDKMRDQDGSRVYRTDGFDYPLRRDRHGRWRVKSGETLRVCMTSDFFLEEADSWRDEAWEIMRIRRDVKFFLLTKRPGRVKSCLPQGWGSGWENVIFNVTAENQRRADERIPLLLELPFKHKGVMVAPFIGPVDISRYLARGQIERVTCGGENYDGARPCHYDWVLSLGAQCRAAGVTFTFIETGTNFVKDGKLYHMPKKSLQSEMAFKSGVSFAGKPVKFRLTSELGFPIDEKELYVPHFCSRCARCGSRPICNGCSGCGKCGAPRDGE